MCFNLIGAVMSSSRRWKQDQLALLEQLYTNINISLEEMQQILGYSESAIRSKASQLGLRRPHPTICPDRWTPEQVSLLKQLYPDEDVHWTELEQRIGRSKMSIQSKANNLGVSRSHPNRHNVNREYFKIIDSEMKAYILGLLAADGNVSSDIRYVIKIGLQKRDRMLLERIVQEIAPKVPITEYRNAYYVSFSSKEMASDLAKYGVVPRKSAIFGWPHAMPDELAIPFILGYFDGDGSLFQSNENKKKPWKWELLGCYDFLVMAKQHIEHQAQVIIHGPARDHKHKRPYLYRIHSGNQQMIKQLDRVLNASGLGLPRKHFSPS
jgi:hypothetical protein